jgi:hypothetical protein
MVLKWCLKVAQLIMLSLCVGEGSLVMKDAGKQRMGVDYISAVDEREGGVCCVGHSDGIPSSKVGSPKRKQKIKQRTRRAGEQYLYSHADSTRHSPQC